MVTSQRMIGSLSQRLEMQLPALLTISTEYRPRSVPASTQPSARRNNYRGKATTAVKWTADDLSADPRRLGLAGSPTIVGTGIDLGKPPVQKVVGKTLVFAKDIQIVNFEGKSYGPYSKGDLVQGLPDPLLATLTSDGATATFGYDTLIGELFA